MKPKTLELHLNTKESVVLLNGTLEGDVSLKQLQAGVVLESGTFALSLTADTEFIVVS